MNDLKMKIIIGGMLHDIGKVLYRADDHRTHGESGYDFLKNQIGISDREILDQVRYHHASALKTADVPDDSPAYITYFADNIAAAADRRKADEDGAFGFDRNLALESIFNLLNGNHERKHYQAATLKPTGKLNMPQEGEVRSDPSFYREVSDQLTDILKGIRGGSSIPEGYVNSLLEVLEADLTYVPSSTARSEVADISLYDHLKLTSAFGSCLYDWLAAHGITNYRKELFTDGKFFYEKDAFLLFSMDISGIQDFIYHQYGTEEVLKNLRARSFYLDIMLENMADELLDKLQLSRANLIYTGGGHAYFIVPNTQDVIEILENYRKDVDEWLLETFGIDLYLACGWTECSANDLLNQPEGSYQRLFRDVSHEVSYQKMHRYTANDIIRLNHRERESGDRECKICHRSDHLTDEDLCTICSGLADLSRYVLDDRIRFFSVRTAPGSNQDGVPIFRNEVLNAVSREKLLKQIQTDPCYVRAYAKNEMYTGVQLETKLWIGDYSSAQTLGELADAAQGIGRLGVLRADIDNLGQAFVNGFPAKYQTLSRAATFSRKLSLFFKLHINDILEHPNFSLEGTKPGKRNATVIYSGGDDVFVIGAWKDIIEFAVDLRRMLKEYSQGTLTVSAGIGIYNAKYPVSYMASQTGILEERSKEMEGKDALTLFDHRPEGDGDDYYTYHWNDFEEHVIGEKYRQIRTFFDRTEDHGKSFLYHIVELFRSRGEKINLARLAYVLARMRPAEKDSKGRPNTEQLEAYRIFSEQIYRWMRSDEDSRQAVMAMYLYAYATREREEEENV